MNLRQVLWQKMASDWKPDNLMQIYTEIKPEDLKTTIESMLKGQLKGRTIVNLID